MLAQGPAMKFIELQVLALKLDEDCMTHLGLTYVKKLDSPANVASE